MLALFTLDPEISGSEQDARTPGIFFAVLPSPKVLGALVGG